MVKYNCERCGKEFSQKSHYDSHNRRKTPCADNTDKIKQMIDEAITEKFEEKFDEKLKELIDKGLIVEGKPKKVVTYVDLFCGLGAFHTAFNRHNDKNEGITYECVFTCDINEGVRAIYEENYDIKPEGDINDIDIHTIPDFDILCAGIPCQSFSIAGKRDGFNDKTKGNLFFRVLDVIDVKQPNTVIIENVRNLHTIHEGRTFETIKMELEKRGYHFSYRVIDSRYYNVPQSRQRIFI
ncbi:unnamed protein product, partial [marine sediment metagenome]